MQKSEQAQFSHGNIAVAGCQSQADQFSYVFNYFCFISEIVGKNVHCCVGYYTLIFYIHSFFFSLSLSLQYSGQFDRILCYTGCLGLQKVLSYILDVTD